MPLPRLWVSTGIPLRSTQPELLLQHNAQSIQRKRRRREASSNFDAATAVIAMDTEQLRGEFDAHQPLMQPRQLSPWTPNCFTTIIHRSSPLMQPRQLPPWRP